MSQAGIINVNSGILPPDVPLTFTTDTQEEFDNMLNLENRIEPEVVWFPKIKALAIQGHPEWAHPRSKYVEYVNRLVEDYGTV